MKFIELFSDEKHGKVLDSILVGSENWFNNQEVDCLITCPFSKSCKGNGPNDLCSSDWRATEVSFFSLSVVIHILKNYAHYDQNDLGFRHLKSMTRILNRCMEQLAQIEDAEFDEGSPYLKSHLIRERKSVEALKLKLNAEENGGLICQSCKINFSNLLGSGARRVVECHHSVPISSSIHGGKTKRVDLVLLCATCHRIAHTQNPVLRPDQIAETLLRVRG
jgi:hypothetical protein